MHGTGRILLHRMVLSLSEALDWTHADTPESRLRFTYIALRIGQHLEIEGASQQKLFLAAAMQNDLLERLSQRLAESMSPPSPIEKLDEPDAGAFDSDVLGSAARIVRQLHTPGRSHRVEDLDEPDAPLIARVLHLARDVSRLIDPSIPVLAQAPSVLNEVSRGVPRTYDLRCADAFVQLAQTEAFWLDCVSTRLHGLIVARVDSPAMPIASGVVQQVARLFAEAVDSLSPWTAAHSAGVATTAACLAQTLDAQSGQVPAMRLAGWFHDLGKLSVPAHVLDKADRLNRQEWAIVRGHPYYTFQILQSAGIGQDVAEWASYHHERIDGKGYPFGLDGEHLSMGARIMAVADAYTALMHDRPHRLRMSQTAALGLLECMAANGALDGDVVEALSDDRDRIEQQRQDAADVTGQAAEVWDRT